MSSPAADPRLPRAREILDAEGLEGVAARVAGHEREIVVLSASSDGWERLAAEGSGLARRLKALGFRYVALDLEPGSPDE